MRKNQVARKSRIDRVQFLQNIHFFAEAFFRDPISLARNKILQDDRHTERIKFLFLIIVASLIPMPWSYRELTQERSVKRTGEWMGETGREMRKKREE